MNQAISTKLRPWQELALNQCLDWWLEKRSDKHFLINAAPGAGKTIAACAIANALFARNEIDRVIVIAPRSEVVNQWAIDYHVVVRRSIMKVTASDGDVSDLGLDLCATWAAVQGLSAQFKAVCNKGRTLLICDEHHHAAVEAAWGEGAIDAFASARFSLILTGTPIRSDGRKAAWLAYDDAGAISFPEEGTYTLTYGEAVEMEYCRPVTFHRHEGRFNVDLDGEVVRVSGSHEPILPDDMKRIPGLQRALNFYVLACTPQYEKDGKTPLGVGYQATMLEAAAHKLDELRERMSDAGGLIVAPSIQLAEYFVKLVELIEGEKPILVHNKIPSADSRIDAFRKSDKRWLVSVAMVSEGVDIPRLRVLIYLSSALTELAFRQAIGRVVRTNGPNDDTFAHVIMPSFDLLEGYALRVENEMPSSKRKEGQNQTKRCQDCGTECERSARSCPECGYEFPFRAPRTKECPECFVQNAIGAKVCAACGYSFTTEFHLTLEEALRTGVIVRGMDIGEEEVREGEALAADVRAKILKSGDANLLRLLRTFPEETFGRLKTILKDEH